MRAPFNRTATLIDGPGTLTPGFPRVVDAPVRLVPDPLFIDVAAPVNLGTAYLTIDVAQPQGPEVTEIVPGGFAYDFNKADRVTVSGLAGITFLVLRVESCTSPDQAPYWRATIAQDSPDPGGSCAASYGEEYEVLDFNDSSEHVLTKTSPLTWEGDGYVLTAEVEWVNEDICLSKWVCTKDGTDFTNINWDGGTSGYFYDYSDVLQPLFITRL